MISTSPFLETEDLIIGYAKGNKKNILFDKLEVKLYGGEMVCFMGPNGAGKSTLIRTLAGLQKPLKGSVKISIEEELSKQIAVVLTDRITANVTAEELITFGRYPYVNWQVKLSDKDHQIINQAIDQVHIRHLLKKQISELSDGQMQMVMIARALAQDTPIILLDEPTAHLDLNNRLEVMKLLKSICKNLNKAILISTHELDLALQTADKIWLTNNKGKILSGIPEDLVLAGSFDDTFQFKGFDLKTGKVIHEATQNITISLEGKSHHLLWTKNALERLGYSTHVINQAESRNTIHIAIEIEETKPRWILTKENQQYTALSIASLLEHI